MLHVAQMLAVLRCLECSGYCDNICDPVDVGWHDWTVAGLHRAQH